jgi:hypothetical protein
MRSGGDRLFIRIEPQYQYHKAPAESKLFAEAKDPGGPAAFCLCDGPKKSPSTGRPWRRSCTSRAPGAKCPQATQTSRGRERFGPIPINLVTSPPAIDHSNKVIREQTTR